MSGEETISQIRAWEPDTVETASEAGRRGSARLEAQVGRFRSETAKVHESWQGSAGAASKDFCDRVTRTGWELTDQVEHAATLIRRAAQEMADAQQRVIAVVDAAVSAGMDVDESANTVSPGAALVKATAAKLQNAIPGGAVLATNELEAAVAHWQDQLDQAVSNAGATVRQAANALNAVEMPPALAGDTAAVTEVVSEVPTAAAALGADPWAGVMAEGDVPVPGVDGGAVYNVLRSFLVDFPGYFGLGLNIAAKLAPGEEEALGTAANMLKSTAELLDGGSWGTLLFTEGSGKALAVSRVAGFVGKRVLPLLGVAATVDEVRHDRYHGHGARAVYDGIKGGLASASPFAGEAGPVLAVAATGMQVNEWLDPKAATHTAHELEGIGNMAIGLNGGEMAVARDLFEGQSRALGDVASGELHALGQLAHGHALGAIDTAGDTVHQVVDDAGDSLSQVSSDVHSGVSRAVGGFEQWAKADGGNTSNIGHTLGSWFS